MTRTTIDIGNTVLCDLCNMDYSNSDTPGGFQFSGKAVCPACAPAFMEKIRGYGEVSFIQARANEGEAFRDFVIRLRGGKPGVITMTSI